MWAFTETESHQSLRSNCASHVIKGQDRPGGKALHIGQGYDFKTGNSTQSSGADVGLIFPG